MPITAFFEFYNMNKGTIVFICLTHLVLILDLGMKNEEIVESEKAPLVEENEKEKNDRVLLGKCFGAVLVCYIIYGICHESITRQVRLARKLLFVRAFSTLRTI